MRPEHRQREPIQAERHATRMSLVAIRGHQMPNRTEVVAVTIEAHARSWFLFGTDRNQQLKLQRLFQLAHRSQPAGSAEERIACRRELMFEPEQLRHALSQEYPSSSKIDDLFRCSQANELPHLEGLEPPDLVGGFVTETV